MSFEANPEAWIEGINDLRYTKYEDETTTSSCRVKVLEAGGTTKRLGFAVANKHVGGGLRTFKKGMQYFTDRLVSHLKEQYPNVTLVLN